MKRKKLFSVIVAGMLVAAQMVMPVAAGSASASPSPEPTPVPDGGFDLALSVKTGVLKVKVPTSMTFAIDQFELTTGGNQIAAGEFEMENFSGTDVKVTVTSVATLGTGVSLVSKKGDASSAAKKAWLAAAARTAWNNDAKDYDDTKTPTASATPEETLGTLTEANANVTTFATDTNMAVQNFYLAKADTFATDKFYLAINNGNYTADPVVPATNLEDKTYTKFYQVVAVTINPDQASSVVTAAANEDLYWGEADNADGTELFKIPKGSDSAWVTANVGAGASFVTGKKYFKVTGTTAKSLKEAVTGTDGATAKFLYAAKSASNTTGGKACFTYLGSLSDKTETWGAGTGKEIVKVAVTYNIAAIKSSRYDAVKNDLVGGLYAGPDYSVAPTPAFYTTWGTTTGYVGLSASAGFSAEPTTVKVGGTVKTKGTDWSYADGWVTITTAPTAGTAIEVVVGRTVYSVTAN